MIRVLVVDDSAIVRKVLSDELGKIPDIEVVGTAVDPYAARDKILELKPDVITLDIEMPRMDGLSFLAKLMHHHPIPVVIVSSVAPENSGTALEAMRLGAIEVIPKPGSQFSIPDVRRKLARAIRAAASASVRASARIEQPLATPAQADFTNVDTTHKLVAIGSSTGGTRALETVLTPLPPNMPGIVVVQHMPAGFTDPLARRLNDVCAIEVREALDGDQVVPGRCLIAPGGKHTLIRRKGVQIVVQVKDGPPVNHHRPSVDVLFESAAEAVGRNAVAAILTGMGSDGARGLLKMRENGAHTVAEDSSTCVVFGMPRAAIELGAPTEVLPLPKIPSALLAAASRRIKNDEPHDAALEAAGHR